jgi:hypothetical protein
LNDSTQTGWTTAKLADAIALIWDGPGYDDFPNYRTISSATSGEATVSSAFTTDHTTSTLYVIRGSDWWSDVGVGSITKPILFAEAPESVVYLSQGRDTPIIRWGEYNNSGTWTSRTAAAEGSESKADGIRSRLDPKDGMQLFRWQNKDKGEHVSISKASTKKWGEDLQFKTTIPIGMDRDKINNIVDGEQYLFVVKEDAIYAVDEEDMPDKVVDFQGLSSELSGAAAISSTPYVYFSLGRGGFERLLDRNMEDIGPWRGEGLPAGRQGYVSAAVGHPQHIFAAVDAGDDGYSALYIYNGGWHEIFRAREAGQRIRSLHYEVLPGETIDKLWIGLSADLGWVPVSSQLNPYYDPSMEYTYEWSVTSAWIDDQIKDMYKYIKELKISGESLSASRYIEWDYQLDDAGDTSAWVRGSGNFDSGPSETISVAQTCKRFRYRLRGYNTTKATPMRILAATTGLVTTIPPKYRCNIQWMIQEEDGSSIDLQGDDDGQTFAGIAALLNTWASSPNPCTTSCVDPDLDGLTVFVQPSPRRPTFIVEGLESIQHVGTVMLQEV